MITVNELYVHKDINGNQSIRRILWIDRENDTVYDIDIRSPKGFPERRTLSDLENAIEEGQVVKEQNDPYLNSALENEISDKDKSIRDKYWHLIENYVVQEPDIFNPRFRGRLINEIAKKHKISRPMVFKIFRRYWQRGMNKNALLPDYFKSGGRGIEKKLGDKKIGRPKKFLGFQGVNNDDNIKRIFWVAITKLYLNQKDLSLKQVFDLMNHESFCEERIEDGIKKRILLPQNQRPTFRQFKYFYKKEFTNRDINRARKGLKIYNKDFRPKLGSSVTKLMGPGSRFQIDSTVFNLYLVSRYNPNWVIGRPILYAVIDTFSRLVCGFYAGFEGPSWLGAMMALVNTVADKVEFCKEYGIDITEDQWPCHHFPEAIIVDRGSEWEGKPIETISTVFNIRIENTAPYHPELKGIVERYFLTTQEKVKPFAPGYVFPDAGQRGAKDYRLQAVYDIYQFNQMMIWCIIHHNQKIISNYRKNETMISDDIQASPLELWNWGIKNRSRLRSFDEDIVKLNLLPKETAKITQEGFQFKKMFYKCDYAEEQGLFDAGSKGSVEIPYDPRNLNCIYLRLDGGRSFQKCYLNEAKGPYFNKTIDEIDNYLGYERLQKAKNEQKQDQNNIDLIEQLREIEKTAIQQKEFVKRPDESKTKIVNGINPRQKAERDVLRTEQAFNLGGPTSNTEEKKIQTKEPKKQSAFLKKQIEMLQKVQKEMQNENN